MMHLKLSLQQAYANQFTNNGIKGEYNIIDKDQNSLGSWPKSMNESEVFHVLDFARKFEKLAYEQGIEDERVHAQAYINEMKQRYEEKIAEILEANEKLANKLGQLIGEEEI